MTGPNAPGRETASASRSSARRAVRLRWKKSLWLFLAGLHGEVAAAEALGSLSEAADQGAACGDADGDDDADAPEAGTGERAVPVVPPGGVLAELNGLPVGGLMTTASGFRNGACSMATGWR